MVTDVTPLDAPEVAPKIAEPDEFELSATVTGEVAVIAVLEASRSSTVIGPSDAVDDAVPDTGALVKASLVAPTNDWSLSALSVPSQFVPSCGR